MNVFGIGLPELGRTLGKTLKGFQSASKEFEREINKAMAESEVLPEASEPATDTTQAKDASAD